MIAIFVCLLFCRLQGREDAGESAPEGCRRRGQVEEDSNQALSQHLFVPSEAAPAQTCHHQLQKRAGPG